MIRMTLDTYQTMRDAFERKERVATHGLSMHRMVHHHVEDDFHSPLVDFINQLKRIVRCLVFGSDVSVAADVVTGISLRRGKERGNPQRLESQFVDVIQFLDNAF